MQSETLLALGWRELFEQPFAPYEEQGCVPARVASEAHEVYAVCSARGELLARLSGKFRHSAVRREDFPAVGDWVAAAPCPGGREAVIHGVLPRFSKFSRKVAGPVTEEQVVAANIDTVFLVSALTADYNPRRIERYLVTAWESGADPVIVLNKADLCADVEARQVDLGLLAAGVPVHAVSAVSGEGLGDLARYLGPGRTVAFLGSSGVGKSTLINRLCGREAQATAGTRDDGRGRHTTTRRQLLPLPGGGLVVDNPGMRELQLWDAEAGLEETFLDVTDLAKGCRFRDCRHEEEPGCAVRQALQDGVLDAERFANYLKLQRELAYLERRTDQRAQAEDRDKWRRIRLEARQRARR